MTAAVPIGLGAKLIGCPDRSFYRERRMFRRSRTPKTKMSCLSRNYWSRIRKEIGRYRWNDDCQDCDTEPRPHRCAKLLRVGQDLTTSRIDKLLRSGLVSKESNSWKEKNSDFFRGSSCPQDDGKRSRRRHKISGGNAACPTRCRQRVPPRTICDKLPT